MSISRRQEKKLSHRLGLVGEPMDRKKLLFPEVKRMIEEFKVTKRGKDFHMVMASTLEDEDAKQSRGAI